MIKKLTTSNIYMGSWTKIAPIENFRPNEKIDEYLLRKFGKEKYEQEEWEFKDKEIKINKIKELLEPWIENGKSKNLLPEYKIGTLDEIFAAYELWKQKRTIVEYYLLNNGIGTLFSTFLTMISNAIMLDKSNVGLQNFQNIITDLFIDTVSYARTGKFEIDTKQKNEFHNGMTILQSHNSTLFGYWNELHLQMSFINPDHPMVKIYDQPESE